MVNNFQAALNRSVTCMHHNIVTQGNQMWY